MQYLFSILMLLILPVSAQAAIHKETIEYKQGDTVLEGYLAYDDAVKDKRPGVIVVHDWMGFGDYGNRRAEQLAELGYVALAVDIFGKGIRPKNSDEASAQAAIYKGNRTLLRQRAAAGLDVLKKHPLVDSQRVAAIGYCFGGTTVLEMARGGAVLNGVVSFHGGLDAPSPAQGPVKPKVLVLHGADDPYVPAEQVAAFQKEMNQAGADWQMVYYSGAVHSFTRKDAGNDNAKGAAYNEKADWRSWADMQQFFKEIFGI
jgi:dienelactone hydrolase